MKTGISLVDLAKRIEENRALKADCVAPASSIRMVPGTTPALVVRGTEPRSQEATFPAIRPVAHDQLGTYLGIPSRYYDKMLAQEPTLLADNVNTWLGKSPDRRMVRTLAGDVRAFLSDRYQRIENEEIAAVVLPVLFEAGVTVRSCEVTERRLYINATLPKLQAELRSKRVGDIVEAGVSIGNSEIGLGACTVSPFVLCLACLNGMTIPDRKLSARHVGRRIEEGQDLNAIFADDTRQADDRAIMLKVRDTVRHSLDEAAFRANVKRMQDLTEGKLTGDPNRAVEFLAAKVGANETERGGILRALIEGGDLSAWGLLNAVTAQAHTAETYDRSMDFVAAGGMLLNLPVTEWRTILAA
jgi:hypothetical protein